MRTRLLDPALVVAGGVLYASSFPPHSHELSAWVALVPLLCVAARARPKGAFAAGFAYGAVIFVGIVAWVVEAVSMYFRTSMPAALALSLVICVLYVSIYIGLFAVAARRLLAAGPWLALFAIPALWVTGELARSILLTGLPWGLLGHSQWRHITLIQVADLGGVYALSFVVASVNVGAYLALHALARTGNLGRLARACAPLAVALVLVVAVVSYGVWRINTDAAHPKAGGSLLALVQGNLPGRWDWNKVSSERSLIEYTTLSRNAINDLRPDLLVWPEYSIGLYPNRDPAVIPTLSALARQTSAGLVFGAPRVAGAPPKTRYYNSAYHLTPTGALAVYDKVHLLPFAEFRPFSLGEAFAADADDDFSAGTGSTVLTTEAGRLGTLICYEVIFPQLARNSVRAGAELLVNLSNDAWLNGAGLGASAQHLAIAVFRSVENRRYLARAASSGISGFVDPLGRPFGLIDAGKSGVTVGEVQARQDFTVYTRCGDVFAWACALFGLAVLPWAGRPRGDS